MGIDLVEGIDLIVKNNVVYKKTIEGLQKVDVIYRRVDDDFLDPDVGNSKSVIGVKGLIKAWKNKNVAIVDDLLATGGTLKCAEELISEVGGNVVLTGVAIELKALKGREKIKSDFFSVLSYD